MFSITAEGTIFDDGVKIGTIESSGHAGKFRNYTVRSRMVETAEGDLILATSLSAAGSAATEIADEA